MAQTLIFDSFFRLFSRLQQQHKQHTRVHFDSFKETKDSMNFHEHTKLKALLYSHCHSQSPSLIPTIFTVCEYSTRMLRVLFHGRGWIIMRTQRADALNLSTVEASKPYRLSTRALLCFFFIIFYCSLNTLNNSQRVCCFCAFIKQHFFDGILLHKVFFLLVLTHLVFPKRESDYD